jgi:hypothetical protein
LIESIPRFPPAQQADVQRQVRIVRWACVAAVGILAVGLWAKMPYLIAEHRRLEPWKIVELWCADILALYWFARFTLVHAIEGEPLTRLPLEDGRKRIRMVTMTGVTVFVVDLLFTFFLMFDERQRYTQAAVTEAQVTAIQKNVRSAESWYEVDCRFQDATGAVQNVHFRVEAKGHEFPATLPYETVEVLRSQKRDLHPIRVRYDPQFPARAWAEGAGWDDGQKIYWFSLLTLFFQAICTGLFILLLVKLPEGDYLPWWWDIYRALPLFVGAFWLFVTGVIDRLLD